MKKKLSSSAKNRYTSSRSRTFINDNTQLESADQKFVICRCFIVISLLITFI